MNRKVAALTGFLLSAVALIAQQKVATEMLAKASRLGDLKSAEALVSAGVDPNSFNQEGRTPLYYAALFNRDDVAAFLIAHDADPNGRIGSKATGGDFAQTPLQIAASMGNFRMASMLITARADVDARTQIGRTALHFAVAAEHLDMIRLLIEKGADVNTRDAHGTSPLDEAVWRGYLDATAILLAQGSRLNEVETKTGATPINEAAYRGKTQVVRYLLQFGPKLDLADNRGYTPLENSIRAGNPDSALLLLEAAAPAQNTPELLNKMVGVAIKRDEATVVKALLQHGADANDALPSGAVPLEAAAAQGAVKVVGVLLARGADPNKASSNGTSPLEEASLRGFSSIAEMLLDRGALVNRVNNASGRTALYAAASFGKSTVVNLLLNRGADPNICGKGNGTAYETAVKNGYTEVATQIQRHGGSKVCTAESLIK